MQLCKALVRALDVHAHALLDSISVIYCKLKVPLFSHHGKCCWVFYNVSSIVTWFCYLVFICM